MEIWQILLAVLILLLAIPSGYLLAYLCRDELIQGRKLFKLLAFFSALLMIILFFFNLAMALACLFISVTSLISLIESFNKRFRKN